MADTFLEAVTVVEVGDRQAVASCGSLLAELGATVILIEPAATAAKPGTKWTQRAVNAAGKRSVVIDPASAEDLKLLEKLLDSADAVLASSDCQSAEVSAALKQSKAGTIVCDVSAFGSSGPLTGRAYSDFLIQAMAGAMDTTGAPEDAPTPTAIPIMEMAASIYAAAGTLAALRVRRMQGTSQRVEIALFDCAVSMLTTFLPGYFAGREPQRIGNHHPSMSPWNAYRASDGWVLMCSGSDDQWRRVCELIACPQYAADPRFSSPTSRVKANAEVDAIVEAWTRERTVADCIDAFNRTGLACGPVYEVADLFDEASLKHRGMIRGIVDPASGSKLRMPGSLFGGGMSSGRVLDRIPAPGEDRAAVEKLAAPEPAPAAEVKPRKGVLEGVRVIEIGNYTTAPLAARQLAALGADVIKLEPPSGDASRALPPHRDGQSYFFTMSNAGKRSVVIDLREAAGKAAFRELLSEADVLVENLKPGSLARLGFGTREIAALNPRLVYCPISGFGFDSPYADRAAMDTTIQAMSGIMDLTRAAGVPYKTGISSADLAGGQLGVVAILAALEYRDRTGIGQTVDLSMQDGAAWLTHMQWNENAAAATCTVRASDGYVAIEALSADVLRVLGDEARSNDTAIDASGLDRDEIARRIAGAGLTGAPVLRVNEVVVHAQTKARALIVTGKSADGAEWPLLACPIRLSATPPIVSRAIGALGADGESIFKDWRPGKSPHATPKQSAS